MFPRPWKSLWKSAKKYNVANIRKTERGVDGKFIKAIRSMYEKTTNKVRAGNAISRPFEARQRLKQGGNLSPALFIDKIMKKLKDKVRKTYIGYL